MLVNYAFRASFGIDNVKYKAIIKRGDVKLLWPARWDEEMAENEYLDSSKAHRWQSVAQAIRGGCSVDELALS